MILLIDLGNTRLKWAWLAHGRLHDGGALLHRGRELGVDLDHAWARLTSPESVQVACVAPAVLRQALADWLAEHWDCPVHWAASQAAAAGVVNGYSEPEQLGVDRWLALLGAWQRVQGAVCVVDCGSAVTVDILDDQGRHLGGVIAPGLRMMRDALRRDTALPPVPDTVADTLGEDTLQAIQGGLTLALHGLVDQARRHAPPHARLLLTGGDASQLAQVIEQPCELAPDLVLEGLARSLDGV